MRINCETYGCTMNKGDSEILLGYLKEAGHEIVDNPNEADLIIVNTCAVKGTTMRRVLHRLRELNDEDVKVIVGGCLPLIDLDAVENAGDFEGITSCLALDQINELVDLIEQGKNNLYAIEGSAEKVSVPRARAREVSAPVAIAEGCVSNCTYCCVKFARGEIRSFDFEKIISEVKDSLKSGNRELLVTAQDTAAYGIDRGDGVRLPELLERIAGVEGDFRVRVGMMNPGNAKEIVPELLSAFDHEEVYKFLHLPVQSGNDDVLNAMNRYYSRGEFVGVVEKFKEKFPDLYLATDIIVGFPGESKEAFQDSCDLIEEVRPDKVNLTRFTPMPGTKAKEMEQVDDWEKKRRSKELSEITREIGYEINKDYVGRVMTGLVTKKGKKGGYVARLPNYKPVIINDVSPGEFHEIEVVEARPTYLMGKTLD